VITAAPAAAALATAALAPLIVRAKATTAGGVGPIMQVLVDGTVVGQAEVKATTYTDYTFALTKVMAAGAKIDVVFTNDATVGTEDRNLYVDSVVANGTTLKPTDTGVTIDMGTGTAAFDGVNVIPGQTDILWNAALRFKAPAAASPTVTVRAMGSLAAGVGPIMTVLADGVQIGNVQVQSTAYTDFAFPLPTGVTKPARIDVVFSNDGSNGTEDRNLYVDSVTWTGGLTMHPTDAGVTIDMGVGTAAFDGVNVIAGQSAILWNGALRFVTTTSTASTTSTTSTATTTTPTTSITTTTASTTTTTPATSTSTSAVPAGALSIASFGAVCDGKTDNAKAIASAIASAKSKGVAVLVPAGSCAYSGVIKLDSVQLWGLGDTSVLYALNTSQESIFMYGSGAQVRQLKLSGGQATTRLAAWEATRIALFGATNFLIDHVTVDGSAAAGIQTAQSTNHGSITNNTIKNTLADSIHMTDKASFITVDNNHIENAGDDGIAVVSYRNDGGLVNNITARNNIILNSKWGRQMSVVGGDTVLYQNNDLENNLASYACVYIAQESSYSTYGAHNVTVQYNTLKNCGGPSTGHGAVMVYSDGQEANTNVSLIRNDIVQSGQPGIRVFSAMNTGITVSSNRVQGASPATDLSSPGVVFTAYTSGSIGYVAP
jgi:hypothetical protein